MIYLSVLFGTMQSCNNVEGTYVANYELGADILKIFINHKYVKIWYPLDSPDSLMHYNDSGTWSVSNGTISFQNWIDRNGIFYSYGEGPTNFAADIKRNFFTGNIKTLD